MCDDFRLLQVFLSPAGRGVFEVSANSCGHLRCTCPGYQVRGRCKHLLWVIKRLVDNGGEYTISVPADVAADVCAAAVRTPETFREFVLRYGSVEVF